MKTISLLRLSKSILEMLSLVATAAIFVMFAVIFKNYPADKSYSIMMFGRGFTIEKITLFTIFLIAAGINAALFIAARFPALYKYPVKITAENIEVQYHLAKIMLNTVSIFVSTMFWFVLIEMYYNAVNNTSFLPWEISVRFSVLIAFIIGFYFWLAHKYK